MSAYLTTSNEAQVAVSVVRDQQALANATPAWLELLDHGTVGHNVYNDPRMILLSLQEKPSLVPRILLVSRGGSLVCVAPFYVQQSSFSFEFSVWRTLTLRAQALRLFGESVVVAADVDPTFCVDAVAEFLRNESRSIDYLQIYGLNSSDRFWQASMRDGALVNQAGWSMIKMRPEKNRQLRLQTSFDAYLATLSSDSRRMVRRHSRNFFKDSTSRIERITEQKSVPQLIDWMTRVHRDSWQAKTFGVDEHDESANRRLLEQVAAQGWLRSYVLLRGDEPIAFKHGYQYRGMLASDATAYCQQYSGLSPGIVLTYNVIEDIHTDRVIDVWDFGFGDLPYKRTFCNEVNDSAIVYFVPRNRWRLMFAIQGMLNWIYDVVRCGLLRLKIDRYIRKTVKRQK